MVLVLSGSDGRRFQRQQSGQLGGRPVGMTIRWPGQWRGDDGTCEKCDGRGRGRRSFVRGLVGEVVVGDGRTRFVQ